jgi:branched-chain amino acid transport system substrate-binding protein
MNVKQCLRMAAVNAIVLATFLTTVAQAQYTDGVVKIGVLSDMSSVYSDLTGAGSVAAAKLAVQDFDPASHGMKVEIIGADHQNKPDIGSSITRQWLDVDGVDVVVDVPTSSVAFAVSDLARERNKVFLISGGGSSDLTGPKCSPNSVHWTFDTWMLAHGTAAAVMKSGGNNWFFLTADYAFGHALERDASEVVLANGGKVLGSVRHPLNTQDFSSFLVQAQNSKANIIGLANAGGDLQNAIKQGADFGITAGGQRFAGLLVTVVDVNALGLKAAQGLVLTEVWYWDMNDANRAWTKRWQAERPGKLPTAGHAGVYSAVLHILKLLLFSRATPMERRLSRR